MRKKNAKINKYMENKNNNNKNKNEK